MVRDQDDQCVACGDPAEQTMKGRPYCLDCYNELAHGVIRNQNIHYFIGGVVRQDDVNPSQENAIRCLEDRG